MEGYYLKVSEGLVLGSSMCYCYYSMQFNYRVRIVLLDIVLWKYYHQFCFSLQCETFDLYILLSNIQRTVGSAKKK